jgi:hypothetical protein
MVDNIRVLNIASNDYANMSHNNANALRSIGVYCNDYALSIHPFGYTSQSKAVSKDRIRDIVNTFDVVQIFHTCPVLLNVIQEANFKGKIIVYHSGTRYRNEPEYWNRVFNPIVHRCITDQTEFMELGAKDIEYLAPHTDLKPTEKRKEGKLIIGHYPSNALVKGTKEIREMLEPFKDDFEIRIDETIIPHEENLKRIAECHIYIELFKPELNGKPYGCFGVTAFEATALGCMVITNDLNKEVYENSICEIHPFLTANTKDAFHTTLKTFNDGIGRMLFDNLKYILQKDFYNNHSIESTGQRILKLIK